ncbi:Thioredoxin-like protein [Venustampulla echinocandica]|uniref:Thioredoxin-like protein n=1 Tax=Venustampulla echinocandica TaxID=2656787 RepID=A0A370TJX4_9HELO|nr:Thioredoxin-like protein [Venustampulla echinocandica]RDL35809.1 Thioredoxin-like protein [Venustampulla echinocandica]
MASKTETPKITLYTSHLCPWAHRSQIALRELGLPFETVIVDLSVPRTPEYLKINPRGLVPALDYNGTIITESGIISQFLVDSHPSHLEKTSSEPGGALQRANINFFVDTWFSKVNSLSYPVFKLKAGEKEVEAGKIVDVIVKEIEPLLQDAAPYFGGSEKLTLAEVQTGSFILRLLSFPKYEELLPKSVLTSLEARAPAFWKWANAVVQEKSVTYVWDEQNVATRTIARLATLR